MSMMKREPKDYSDGRTKQSFKDQCDINKLLYKAARTGTLSHLEQFGGQYGDFSDFDFHLNMNRLAEGRQIFEQLPAEIRREFKQDPQQFFEYVNKPENRDRLAELLPHLAEQGTQRIDVLRTAGNQQQTQGVPQPPQEVETPSEPVSDAQSETPSSNETE